MTMPTVSPVDELVHVAAQVGRERALLLCAGRVHELKQQIAALRDELAASQAYIAALEDQLARCRTGE